MLLNVSYTTILKTAIADVTSVLTTFAGDPLFAEKFALAFGITFSSEQFLQTVAVLPQIEVRSDAELKGALGAFSAQTQKIYLSESLLKGDSARLRSVLIEEIGHYVDAQVNSSDSSGDEGTIFAALVLGLDLSASRLAQLKAEDDHAVVVINGQETAIEMANATAIQLNGANQQVDVGTWFNYQNFTVEMWVKAGETQVTYADIIDNNHTDYRSWVVQQNANTTNSYSFGVSGSPGAGVSFELTPSTWQHLAFVKDVNSISVYIDGIIVGSTPYSGSIPYDGSQFLRIGNWGGGGRNWNGSIDEVRIWNTARTASEIADNYNGSISPNSTGLVAYYAFDEGTGSTSADLTLNGNTANLINNPVWTNVEQSNPNSPLINGLGGTAGFGENILDRNDDGSTGFIDVTSVFESGLNFFGTTYNGFYLNNNGNITFTSPLSTFTPFALTGDTGVPIIAAFFTDIDTRAGVLTTSSGGNSTGSNLVYWDIDSANNQVTLTWDDVGEFPSGRTPNAFQLLLKDLGAGDFSVEFRYEDIQWYYGNARAGYSAANGVNFFELSQSGSSAMLDLELTSNINQAGTYTFFVVNGTPNQQPTNIVLSTTTIDENTSNSTVIGNFSTIDPDVGDTHTYSLVNNAGGRFAIVGNQLTVANSSFLDFEVNSILQTFIIWDLSKR
jgi:hypothetical protein